MKLKDYIEKLQEYELTHGELEVVYAKDDEGNGYQKVGYSPTIAYFENITDYHLERVDADEATEANSVKAIIIN